MKIETFIHRPVLASGISILIVLLGVIGLFSMPVEQYPNLAPPTVQINTTYPGANAETVQKSVITPLEESINGVEDMLYMTSTSSSYGNATIRIFFRPGTDPDVAAVNVQNRVATATSRLPSEVTRTGVTIRKQQTGELLTFALYSPDGTFDRPFLVNYAMINIQPALLRIAGVGDANVVGQSYAMRIELDPALMAQYKLVPDDITRILSQQNIEVSMGDLGANSDNTLQYALKYTGRLTTPEEFGDMVVRSLPDGNVLRLRDVASIRLGEESDMYIAELGTRTGLLCRVYQIPGSNATEVTDAVQEYLESVQADFPRGMEMVVMQNNNEFLSASIHNVIRTLIEAIVLVVLVVLFFLHGFRITLIPTLSILVSLIGTFAVLSVAGFSINLLTLFALVLVIGTVVDDSIVVVEAVQARFDMGEQSPFHATRDGMKGITNAIITSSLIFMAVFIPVCFISGPQGAFYTQFGVAMAIAVAISAVNSLTLCPALCVLLMRPEENLSGKGISAFMKKAYNASYYALSEKYKNALFVIFRHRWITGISIICVTVLLVVLMRNTPTGFIPAEDTGVIYQDVAARPGSSLKTTHEIQLEIAKELEQIPQIESYSQVSGNGMTSGQGSPYGYAIIRLKPWEQRPGKENSSAAVITEINKRMSRIKDVRVLTYAPPMIPGYGSGNTIEMYMQDRKGSDITTFYNITQEFLQHLADRPEIGRAFTSFNPNFPQYEVSVDAALCERSGTTPDAVLGVIGGYCGSIYASDFNRFSKVYHVMVQALPEYRLDEHSLENMFVRIGEGENARMAPVSRFVKLKPIHAPFSLYRFNLFGSISVNITPAEGYSSGDVLDAIREVAETHLPRGYSYEFGGMAREEGSSIDTAALIFALCILFIYLLLSMLYESYLIPFAVLLSVPFGIAGSFLFTSVAGLENNIYMQTGLIMLIGLLAKTAILLTEYASMLRAQGLSLVKSAFGAAKARLRPVLMTALTMVFGMLPMMFASGVGANGNHSLGTGVVGGMLVGIVALLLLVPPLFVFFQGLQERLGVRLKR
ncbi:efflux RND transporter permease subunit [Bacteroides salyersiae]|uniref:efflux RND transporter permease subunit n=1 Tax=Bacteroides salyersiae TaxID=291644 RepID=UPI0034A19E4D